MYVHIRYLDRAADFGLKKYEGAEKFGGRTRTFVIRTTGSPEKRGAKTSSKDLQVGLEGHMKSPFLLLVGNRPELSRIHQTRSAQVGEASCAA